MALPLVYSPHVLVYTNTLRIISGKEKHLLRTTAAAGLYTLLLVPFMANMAEWSAAAVPPTVVTPRICGSPRVFILHPSLLEVSSSYYFSCLQCSVRTWVHILYALDLFDRRLCIIIVRRAPTAGLPGCFFFFSFFLLLNTNIFRAQAGGWMRDFLDKLIDVVSS